MSKTKLFKTALLPAFLVLVLAFGPIPAAKHAMSVAESLIHRWSNPNKPFENKTLHTIECFQATLDEIPHGSKISVVGSEDSFLNQRIAELSIGRLELSEPSAADYLIDAAPTDATDQVCGSYNLKVVNNE